MADYRTTVGRSRLSRLRYTLDGTDQRSLAGMGAAVVLLHLVGIGLLSGLLLPDGYRLGDDRQGVLIAAGIVAYVLGLRRAFDPRHLTAVGDSAAELARRGRRSLSVGFWFALGYAASVTALALLLTMGVQGVAWWNGLDGYVPQLIIGAADAGVFLGILGIVSIAVLFSAVRRRAAEPVAGRPLVRRLTEWARRPWQLFVVGLVFGAGLGVAAEAGLLVLATGMAVFVLPAYPVVVLPVLFAAGMSLGGLVQGVLVIDPYGTPEEEHDRCRVCLIASAAFAGVMALAVSVLPMVAELGDLPDLMVPGGVAGSLDVTDGPIVEIAQVLVSWPVLILLLLLAAAVVVVMIRRRGGQRDDAAVGESRQDRGAAGRGSGSGQGAAGRGSGSDRRAAGRGTRKDRAAARREAREARNEEKRQAREAKAAEKWEAREAARREDRMVDAGQLNGRRPAPDPDPRRSEPASDPWGATAVVPAQSQAGAAPPQTPVRGRASVHTPARERAQASRSVPGQRQQATEATRIDEVRAAQRPSRSTGSDQGGARRSSDRTEHWVPEETGPQPVVAPITTAGVAVVTAAGAGLGRAIASGLASAGYGIVAVDPDPGNAEACATQVRAFGVPARALRADIRDPGYLERVVAAADELGGPTVLVNSVGGAPDEPTAAMLVSQFLLDPMRSGGGGSIVDVVSSPEVEDRMVRFTASLAGPALGYGVRAMCVTADPSRTHPADVVTAVLDLIQRGRAGAVVQMQAVGFRPGVVRGSAAVG